VVEHGDDALVSDRQTVVANPRSVDEQQARCAFKTAKAQGYRFYRYRDFADRARRANPHWSLNKAGRNDKIAVRDALYAYLEKYFDPETPPAPE
jgi:hypothetical protein